MSRPAEQPKPASMQSQAHDDLARLLRPQQHQAGQWPLPHAQWPQPLGQPIWQVPPDLWHQPGMYTIGAVPHAVSFTSANLGLTQ